MIVSENMARESLTYLRMWARAADEKFDAPPYTALEGLQPAHVKDLYRTAVKYTHPDHGGTAENFAVVDRAKHVLEGWLVKAQPKVDPRGAGRVCDRCGGSGRVEQASKRLGGRGLRVQCPRCGGLGELS